MSKSGISRASMRIRVALAAAVLAGGGAAGVVAVSASHSGPTTAKSAGFVQASSRTMSYTSALSSAIKGWSKSPSKSLVTISHMKPMTDSWTQSGHRATMSVQRGTVLAVDKGRGKDRGKSEIAVRSANGKIEIWHLSGGTKTLNVAGTSTGMSAMTGGTMQVPAWWHMNTKVKGIAKGDLVFVFGEHENHSLEAELVLFAAPTAVKPTATPTPTATVTPTASASAVTPTGAGATFIGTHS